MIGTDVDEAYVRTVARLTLSAARELKALYTPLHGVGETSVFRVLQEAGFEGIEVFEPQREADGNFPNVPDHLPNPELPAVFGPPIEQARASGAALVLASDPDADRLGVAVRSSTGDFVHLSGNRIAVLLTTRLSAVQLQSGGHAGSGMYFVVETLATTPLVAELAPVVTDRTRDRQPASWASAASPKIDAIAKGRSGSCLGPKSRRGTLAPTPATKTPPSPRCICANARPNYSVKRRLCSIGSTSCTRRTATF